MSSTSWTSAEPSVPRGQWVHTNTLKTITENPLDYIKAHHEQTILLRSRADYGDDVLVWGPFNVDVYDEDDVHNDKCSAKTNWHWFCQESEGNICVRLAPADQAGLWLSHSQQSDKMRLLNSTTGCSTVIEVHEQGTGGVLDFRYADLWPRNDQIGMMADTTSGTKAGYGDIASDKKYQWELVEETIPATPESTAEPTAEPAPAPTAEPTVVPTNPPTPQPTPALTAPPTSGPPPGTPAPTSEPSETPTAEPTAPTPAPSILHTPEPTARNDMHANASGRGFSTGTLVGLIAGGLIVIALVVSIAVMSVKRRNAPRSRPGRHLFFDPVASVDERELPLTAAVEKAPGGENEASASSESAAAVSNRVKPLVFQVESEAEASSLEASSLDEALKDFNDL